QAPAFQALRLSRLLLLLYSFFFFFFFNHPATPEIYTLSLHDALPISLETQPFASLAAPVALETIQATTIGQRIAVAAPAVRADVDRKSTRLNSSHDQISYAVFCLKKKKKQRVPIRP